MMGTLVVKGLKFLLNSDSKYCSLAWLFHERYKVLNHLPGGNFREVFAKATHTSNFRSESETVLSNINRVTKGRKSINYFGSVV